MVDMKSATAGILGIVTFLVVLVVGAVIVTKIGAADNTVVLGTNTTDVGALANNASIILRDIPSDWGQIMVLGIIAISVLAPLLFALIAIARQGGDEGRGGSGKRTKQSGGGRT